MIWGYFASTGPGALVKIEGTMNSNTYQDILTKNLVPSARKLKLGRKWTFNWLSQSPALNPIEHLWIKLKKAVHKRKPKGLKDLEQFCQEKWSKSPPEKCQNLIKHYMRCLVSVIHARGGFTKY